MSAEEKARYNYDKRLLLNTALAVGGYFLAAKYAGRVGLNLLQVGALTTLVFPEAVQVAVGGHCVFYGIKGAIAAGKTRDLACFAKFTALAVWGYFGNTYKAYDLINKCIYNKIESS